MLKRNETACCPVPFEKIDFEMGSHTEGVCLSKAEREENARRNCLSSYYLENNRCADSDEVLLEFADLGKHSHITIGHMPVEMGPYLKQNFLTMLSGNDPDYPVPDVGYHCGFSYNWKISPCSNSRGEGVGKPRRAVRVALLIGL